MKYELNLTIHKQSKEEEEGGEGHYIIRFDQEEEGEEGKASFTAEAAVR